MRQIYSMNISDMLSQFGPYAATFIFCILSGIVPVINAEVYLVSISALLPDSLLQILAIIFLATLGQMISKSIMFFASQGVINISSKKKPSQEKIEKVREKMEKWGKQSNLFIFVSGWSGFPPFFIVTVVAGLLKFKFANFFIFGSAGRFIRFSLCVGVPQLLKDLVL